MDNSGNKLTQDKLKAYNFKKEIVRDADGDEIKWWIKDGISIHEESWWLIETDRHGDFLDEPISKYDDTETPEITFSFAVYIKSDGSFKSGYSINTDRQLENLYFALTSKQL